MKKILYSILLFLLILFPANVLAEGYISLSSNSLTIEEGSSKTFTITAYNTIGDVTIKSNNSGVASVNTGTWGTGMVGEKETKRGTITVKGNKVGTTTITLTLDAATFDGDDLAGQTKTINVNVVAKPTPKPKPSNTNTNKPTNSNSNTNNNLSKNNNLKELSVEGYSLNKIDNNHYSLTVGNNVTNVNIKAVAEDSKSTVSGAGKKDLKVGENNFEVVVTSESGAQNKFDVKITRKEDSSLEDLDSLLNDSKLNEIDITISDDTVIPSATIQKIKDKKKTVNFNYYDENKKLKYTWVVDGNKVGEPKDILTTISNDTTNKKEISKASNYAEGLYASFKHKGDMPKGIKIKLSVEDKFEEGYVVKLYQYEASKLNFIRDDLNVKNGTIEFEVEKGNDYFVTMSSIGNIEDKVDKKEPSKINIFMIISIIEFIIIIILMIVLGKKNKKKDDNNDGDSIRTNSQVDSEKMIQEKNTIDSTFTEDIEDIDLEENNSNDNL